MQFSHLSNEIEFEGGAFFGPGLFFKVSDAFGEFGKYYVRCSYAYSMKNLVQAVEKIAEFVKELKSKENK